MLPRWGTLLTYGRALVIRMLRLSLRGNLLISLSTLTILAIDDECSTFLPPSYLDAASNPFDMSYKVYNPYIAWILCSESCTSFGRRSWGTTLKYENINTASCIHLIASSPSVILLSTPDSRMPSIQFLIVYVSLSGALPPIREATAGRTLELST